MLTSVILLLGVSAAFASPVLPGGRIVGGRDADIEEVPWQISLLRNGRHTCGGSIISEYWVVSAAHCVTSAPNRFSVRVGSSVKNAGGIVYEVEKIISHPSHHTPVTHSNDISLIKLVEPITFSAQAQPIRLPAQSEEGPAPGSISTISGWGTLTYMGPSATTLQIVEVPITTQEYCRAGYGEGRITQDMLCAGTDEGGIDACQGDSGGPLVVGEELHGLVSWGFRCAVPKSPGVYTKVSFFRDWIRENSGV
ncbi:trypsin 3A1 [Athalia rosae]|uniref:trypsin 3A1 n=1 Tax=Athalia rosae TaxID=37344 RepID=UPI00062682CE|nr:trypsin 3A1 [Athalia rosae]